MIACIHIIWLIFLCSDVTVELPLNLMHPKPEGIFFYLVEPQRLLEIYINAFKMILTLMPNYFLAFVLISFPHGAE